MTLEDALEGYWLEKRRNLSPATIRDYTLTFTRFCEYLGEDFRFERITSAHIRVFLEDLKDKGLSTKSTSNCWTALSSLWTWAAKELSVPHIMRDKVAKPRVRRSVIEPYTRADIGLMLQACANNATWVTRTTKRTIASDRPEKTRDRAIILVLLDTGIRAQELCNLRMKDFDNKIGKLTIKHGKGDKSRIVYMGETARKALWRYLVERGRMDPEEPILATKEGTALDRAALRKMIVRCAERAGVARAGVHKFRHTFAINFLRNGGSVLELQHMLGHERLDTVRIYASLADSDLKKAQEKASPADNWRF